MLGLAAQRNDVNPSNRNEENKLEQQDGWEQRKQAWSYGAPALPSSLRSPRGDAGPVVPELTYKRMIETQILYELIPVLM